ncbi:MAG TPA: hypothetical protein VFT45_24585 [Longimicrobium sp.]|nr:hypothetical protein [Longimicrobium sp.]
MTNDDASGWELWRQDDNGNRFLIGRFATPDAAEAEQRRFEALGHKQTYWVAAARDVEADDRASSDGPGAGRGTTG